MTAPASGKSGPFPALPAHAGIGLKPQHYEAVLDAQAQPGRPAWVEVHPQNYFCDGGPPHRWLSVVAEQYPLSFHSVGLSLGSADGVIADQLDRLASLCERYKPAMVSDHLSFSGSAHDRFADLLPVPYTSEALDHFAAQVDRVQQRIGRQMLIENPSCYLAYADNEMTEPCFLTRLTEITGCGLLLDINNIVVTTGNLGGDPRAWLAQIEPDRVGEIHLAGHATEIHDSGPLYIDDHGSPVGDMAWMLYFDFITAHGAKPTLVEWDTDTPDYATYMAEAHKAQAIIDAVAG
ncbi:DUF692 domain-containing protein [Sphingorhabdus sp.]|uniref:MNIO family bufferin maturase n=1 Tax=Sphingorhabdus sp. TaxID=1902408 RepID=UPI0035AE5B3E|nr:DUF692 domain-containing protein [Sphingomonadaceae bacterium]